MYNIKRERTGRILKANFDHEVSTLESFKTKSEAVAGIKSRRRALEDDMPFEPTFQDGEDEFTMIVEAQDYNAVCRFYIEED